MPSNLLSLSIWQRSRKHYGRERLLNTPHPFLLDNMEEPFTVFSIKTFSLKCHGMFPNHLLGLQMDRAILAPDGERVQETTLWEVLLGGR